MGNTHPNIVPYQVFPAADGHLIIACGNDRQFAALCSMLGLDGVSDHPAYATNPARVENREALSALIAEKTRLRPKVELIAGLEKAGVPGGPINTVAEAINDPQIQARELRIDPQGLPGLRTPILLSRSPLALERAAPVLGAGSWGFSKKPGEEKR
ncbi:Acetyl-CoA:oxalate CoA-transferase [compost metagenome]